MNNQKGLCHLCFGFLADEVRHPHHPEGKFSSHLCQKKLRAHASTISKELERIIFVLLPNRHSLFLAARLHPECIDFPFIFGRLNIHQKRIYGKCILQVASFQFPEVKHELNYLKTLFLENSIFKNRDKNQRTSETDTLLWISEKILVFLENQPEIHAMHYAAPAPPPATEGPLQRDEDIYA